MEEMEDWYTCVLTKLFDSGINTHHKYIRHYENGSINIALSGRGYKSLKKDTMKPRITKALSCNLQYRHSGWCRVATVTS